MLARGRQRARTGARVLGDPGSSSRSAATASRGPRRSASTRGCCCFTLALAVVAALLAGLVPALQASRPAVVDEPARRRARRRTGREPPHAQRAGRGRSRAGVRAARRRRHAGADAVEHAARRPRILHRRDRHHELSLPGALFAGPPEVRAFYARLLERVRALPGVESAATRHRRAPAAAGELGHLPIEGRPLPPRTAHRVPARDRVARVLRNAGHHARRRAHVHRPGSRRRAARHGRQRNVRAAKAGRARIRSAAGSVPAARSRRRRG